MHQINSDQDPINPLISGGPKREIEFDFDKKLMHTGNGLRDPAVERRIRGNFRIK